MVGIEHVAAPETGPRPAPGATRQAPDKPWQVVAAVPTAIAVVLLWVAVWSDGAFAIRSWGPLAVFALVALAAGRRNGASGAALAMVATLWALALWSAVSLAWSDRPGPGLEGTGRTLLYAALASLPVLTLPTRRWAVHTARLITVAAAGLVLLSLAVLLVSGADLFVAGRLDEPVGYRNGTGALLTMCFWPLTSVAVNRRSHLAVRTFAFALGTCALGMALLTQSRGAVLGFAFGVAVALALGPERSRRIWATILAVAAVALASDGLMAPYDAFAESMRTVPAAVDEARSALVALGLGALALGLLLCLVDGGLRVSDAMTRRLRIASAAGLAVLALVVAGVGLARMGDPIAFVDRKADEFTRLSGTAAPGGSRLSSAGGQRYDLWRIAWREFAAAPLTGGGEGAYSVRYFRDRATAANVDNPHSEPLRVLAELGLIGALLLLATLVAAALALSARVAVGDGTGAPLGVRARRRGRGGDRAVRGRLAVAHPRPHRARLRRDRHGRGDRGDTARGRGRHPAVAAALEPAARAAAARRAGDLARLPVRRLRPHRARRCRRLGAAAAGRQPHCRAAEPARDRAPLPAGERARGPRASQRGAPGAARRARPRAAELRGARPAGRPGDARGRPPRGARVVSPRALPQPPRHRHPRARPLTPVRALILTHYYPPEAGAPQLRLAALAAGLVRRGWDVTVHTGFPHYPTGRIAAPYRNRPLLREIGPGGERVLRSAIYPAPNRGFARRLAGHLSLAASALATAPASGPADVVLAESPPLFTAAAGVPYAAAKRAPLVVHVADRWPASAVELGALTQPRAIAAAEALERWIYARATRIAVPTEGLLAGIGALDQAAGKVVRVPPAVDLERFEAPARAAAGGPLRVLYAGTIGLAHGIDTLLEAARRAGPEVVRVTIAGGGAEAERLAAAAPNVRSLGVVPAGEVPGLYADADAGVVLLRDRPVFAGALPTKLLEGMAAGRAMVVSARGEAAALVEQAGAGLAVAPEDPEALATAFRTLHGDVELRARLGAAGRGVARERYGRAAWLDAWAALLAAAAHHESTASSASATSSTSSPVIAGNSGSESARSDQSAATGRSEGSRPQRSR